MEKSPLIFERMAAVMAEIEAVDKAATNPAQGFKFRSIDQIFNMIHPILKKYQVFFRQEELDCTKTERVTSKGTVQYCVTLKIQYFFTTIDGSFISSIVSGEAVDTGDKATTKAKSFAFKYCLLQTFCIPTEETLHEADYHTPENSIDIDSMIKQALLTQEVREKNNIFTLYRVLPSKEKESLTKAYDDVFKKNASDERLSDFYRDVVSSAANFLKKN